jgi:uncharacterized protein (TIGR03435 family)
MLRTVSCLGFLCLWAGAAWGQTSDAPPSFEIADVHVSAKDPHHSFGGNQPANGRFEFHSATMVELIQAAWGVDQDKILGGPNWLELDRFDVVGKLPAGMTQANAVLPPLSQDGENNFATTRGVPPYLQMLQSLLAERFKLVVRKDPRPFPAYILTAGKKPLLKASDGTGDTGCRVLNHQGPYVAGSEIQYACRNLSMATFAGNLSGILGTELGGNPVMDRTGLKGLWNIEFKWQLPAYACLKCDLSADDRAQFFDAVEKQLGLKLELQQVPIPVILVESVNRKPTENAPGVAEALPGPKVPTEFDVASIKPTSPDFQGQRQNIEPNGRMVLEGVSLDDLLMATAGSSYGIPYRGWIIGMPSWAASQRFDITAIPPKSAIQWSFQSFRDNTLQPLMRALLEQRFGLKTHAEEREVPAYSLVAVKPKMKKGDPASRSHCLNTPAPQGAPTGTVVLTCQNIPMDVFADRYVRNFGTAFGTIFAWPPVLDATGLEGGWDFTLQYVQTPVNQNAGRVGDAGPSAADVLNASDPGGGLTVTEAVEKQLGLKLELRKRAMPVTVIDHLDQKPTEN